MAAYGLSVSVDKVFIDFQRTRSSDKDNDWLTLIVTTAKDGRTYSVSAYQLSDTLTSGEDISDFLPPIVIDNLLLSDDDEIMITCSIRNLAYDDDKLHKAIESAAVIIGAVGFIEEGLLGFPNFRKPITEGKILGALALALGVLDIFIHTANCDGNSFLRIYPPRRVAQIIEDTQGIVGRSFTYPLDPYSERNGSGCGHDPVTRVAVSINLTSADPNLTTLPSGSVGPPGPVVKLRSAAGARPSAWDGQWVDERSTIFAQVRSVVTPMPPMDTDAFSAWLSGVASLIVGGGPSLAPTPSLAPGEMPMTTGLNAQLPSHFEVDVTETVPWFVGTRDLTSSSLLAVALPTSEPARTTDRYAAGPSAAPGPVEAVPGQLNLTSPAQPASPLDAAAGGGSISIVPGVGDGGPGPGDPEGGGGSISIVPGVGDGGPGPGDPEGGGGSISIVPGLGDGPSVFSLAGANLVTSMGVAPGVSLSLWGGYDEADRFVEHRLRYLRLGADGSVTTDVMLGQPLLVK